MRPFVRVQESMFAEATNKIRIVSVDLALLCRNAELCTKISLTEEQLKIYKDFKNRTSQRVSVVKATRMLECAKRTTVLGITGYL